MKKLHVEDLLQYWGSAFINIVYQCCFNTEPSQIIINQYLDKLDKGTDRILIIQKITTLPGSKLTLDDIVGANKLLKKIQTKESVRKLFKPVKPVYWILTNIKKQKSTERIILNRTYEIMHHLNGNPYPTVDFLNTLNANPLMKQGFSITELSEEEQQTFHKILQQL